MRITRLVGIIVAVIILLGQNTTFAQNNYSAQDDLKQQILFYDDRASNSCQVNSQITSNDNVYVVGDSYAQGIEGSLKPKLSELGYEVSGWNAVRGRSITSGGSDPSNPSQTGLQALEVDSDTIKDSGTMIVMLGTNGINSPSDITDFMNKAHAYNPNIRTFWVNVNYPDGTADSINQRNKSILSGASELKYTVIDWYAASKAHMSDYFGDSLHPNATGYKVIAGLLESAMQPSSTGGTSSVTTSSGVNNTDYAGNNILNKAQLDAIQENQPFYQAAADKYGMPWQIIAVIHLREHRLERDGPSNMDGPYQITTHDYKVGDYTDEEFQAATDKAAAFILNKAGGKDLANIDNIKDTLFAYNGKGDRYFEQAKNLGFSPEQANIGEGSPYVMNRADAKRDPTVEPTKSNSTWGQYKNGGFEYPANPDYGAFVQYGAIANISSNGGCAESGLNSGGMTLDQAKAFMETYKTSPDSEKYVFKGAGGNPRAGGSILANCTAFSSYFINKYTSLKGLEASPVGNGWQTVGTIVANNSGLSTGTEPKVYAVFSYPTGDTGHTGVILGIDLEKGIVITGEASWSSDFNWIGAYTHTLQEIKDESWTFAYTDGYLKGL